MVVSCSFLQLLHLERLDLHHLLNNDSGSWLLMSGLRKMIARIQLNTGNLPLSIVQREKQAFYIRGYSITLHFCMYEYAMKEFWISSRCILLFGAVLFTFIQNRNSSVVVHSLRMHIYFQHLMFNFYQTKTMTLIQ